MALFKKTKSENEYQTEQDHLNENANTSSSADRIYFKEIFNDSDTKDCGLKLKQGRPIVVNFGRLEIDDANKDLAFLSGVTFALEGEIVKIREKVFLFAKKEDFLDGTIKNFLKQL